MFKTFQRHIPKKGVPPGGGGVVNGPFLCCPKPLFESEAKCKTIDIKMTFYCHENKLIFTRKILHLASF